MPTYYAPLMAALREAIGAAWPDVVANGIFRPQEFALLALQDRVGDLPAAVVDVELRPSAEWGRTNDVEDGEIVIYRIENLDPAGFEDLEETLQLLQTRLRDVALDMGQVIGLPRISTSMTLPLNDYFFQNKRPYWAGAVIPRVIVGQTR
jgi:hypothetical protein